LIEALMSLYCCLALLALATGGLLLMFSPALGRRLLQNAAVSLGMFVLGSMLLQACCSKGRS
jgi:hypothetical protein